MQKTFVTTLPWSVATAFARESEEKISFPSYVFSRFQRENATSVSKKNEKGIYATTHMPSCWAAKLTGVEETKLQRVLLV
mgnify:CR=1 FL=1|jgi:hypothetical protein